jgi:hypothetical protein
MKRLLKWLQQPSKANCTSSHRFRSSRPLVEQLEDRKLLSALTFQVKPGSWVHTGVQMKTGHSFDITATGTCSYSGRNWGPAGLDVGGDLEYYLQAKIGADGIIGSGTAIAFEDGELLLGIPGLFGVKPDDSKIQGFFTATVSGQDVPPGKVALPTAPDLVATSLTRNGDGGASFSYAVQNAPLPRDTTVAVYWGDGNTPLVPIASIPAQHGIGKYGPFTVDAIRLSIVPAGATNLVEIADPDNLIPEDTNRQNNTFALDWYSTFILDANVANLIRNDVHDHKLVTYEDMKAVFIAAENEGPTVQAGALTSLQFLANYSVDDGDFMEADVQYLTGKVANGDPGNANYQYLDPNGYEKTDPLGNLKVGSSSDQLKKLVNKWFLGVNEPLAYKVDGGGLPIFDPRTNQPIKVAYGVANGSLGTNGPVYTDVQQGYIGDCWLMASLAEAAKQNKYLTNNISNMFKQVGTDVVNINGQATTVPVWTVRIFNASSQACYVTVDSVLPMSGGKPYYAQTPNGVLWVALAEKAFAEAQASGMVGPTIGSNSYVKLSGEACVAEAAITGQEAVVYDKPDPTQAEKDFQAGRLVVLATGPVDPGPFISHSHDYALVGYNSSSSMPFTLYNPWGKPGIVKKNGVDYYGGVFYANAAAISDYFGTQQDTTGDAPPESAPEQLSLVSLAQSARQGDQPADSTLVRSVQPVQTSAALDRFFASVNAQQGLMLARHKNDGCLHEIVDDTVELVL